MSGSFFVSSAGQDLVPVALTPDEVAQALDEVGGAEYWDGSMDGPLPNTESTIYIRKKLNFGQRQELIGISSKMELDAEGLQAAQAKAQAEGRELTDAEAQKYMTGGMDMGSWNKAIAQLFFANWMGPGFEGVACTPDSILQLHHDHPLVAKALTEANKRGKYTRKKKDAQGQAVASPK